MIFDNLLDLVKCVAIYIQFLLVRGGWMVGWFVGCLGFSFFESLEKTDGWMGGIDDDIIVDE